VETNKREEGSSGGVHTLQWRLKRGKLRWSAHTPVETKKREEGSPGGVHPLQWRLKRGKLRWSAHTPVDPVETKKREADPRWIQMRLRSLRVMSASSRMNWLLRSQLQE